MKHHFIFSVPVVLAVCLASCHEKKTHAIQFNELPQTAQTFVETHFADKEISVILYDAELADKSYEATFTDGANVDFDKSGEWEEVEDRDTDGVPAAVIPAGINEHLAANHPALFVVQIGKDRSEYEVELNNGVDLVYDKNGQFVRYDD